MSATGANLSTPKGISKTCLPQESPLAGILLACLARAKSWTVPRSWSLPDWFQEVEQLVQVAAWEAVCDYDTSATTSCESFIYNKIIARVYTTYRRELSYGWRFVCGLEHQGPDNDDQPDDTQPGLFEEPAPQPPLHFEILREAVAALPPNLQFLIQELVWSGRSETEIGQMVGLSQSSVSRQKDAALGMLRAKLSGEHSLTFNA